MPEVATALPLRAVKTVVAALARSDCRTQKSGKVDRIGDVVGKVKTQPSYSVQILRLTLTLEIAERAISKRFAVGLDELVERFLAD